MVNTRLAVIDLCCVEIKVNEFEGSVEGYRGGVAGSKERRGRDVIIISEIKGTESYLLVTFSATEYKTLSYVLLFTDTLYNNIYL